MLKIIIFLIHHNCLKKQKGTAPKKAEMGTEKLSAPSSSIQT